jgi:hypothetical protein
MTPDEEKLVPDMSAADLYREEVYSDRKVGTLRELTPVNADGTRDQGRPVLYVGQTQLMTAMGALPIGFEIEAANLAEAIKGFADAANQAVEQTLRELQEMRREAASSIVIPEAGGGLGGLGGAGGPGGLPGGGKIQLR